MHSIVVIKKLPINKTDLGLSTLGLLMSGWDSPDIDRELKRITAQKITPNWLIFACIFCIE